MSKKTKRSFVLRNFKVRFVKPAAFAVGDCTPEDESKSDVVREAEAIIDAYLKKMGYDGVSLYPERKKHRLFFTAAVISCVALSVYMIVRFL